MLSGLLLALMPILKPLGAWLVGIFTKDLIAFINDSIITWQKRREVAAIQKQNVKDLKEAVLNGDNKKEEESVGNILNGTKPSN